MAQQLPSDRDDARPHVVSQRSTGPGQSVLRRWLVDLRRLWWLVALIVIMAVAAGYYATSRLPTTYTSRSSLIVNSNNRSPDQDAVLVQGYVDYFNNASYQRQLARQAGLDAPVTLVARAAASSPILIVESTAGNPDLARSSAAAVAEAFRADINSVMDEDQAAKIKDLQNRLDQAIQAGGADSPIAATLQDQIAQVQDDRTNRLQELQLRGGVSTNVPSMVSNVGLAGTGGLVLGMLVALAMGALTPRARRGPSRA